MLFREVFMKMHKDVEDWIKVLCSSGFTVILFGSRARGEARIDSDWDLIVIGSGQAIEPPNDLVQVYFTDTLTAEAEIMKFNTLFVDAFHEGKLICGDFELFNRLRVLALERTRGFMKTRNGWIKAD
ncbi:nucleotidyltransferase domain-containing protein [Caldivirga sp.]|uniref:nucleotidyltransferase domain-containing protein n=1 Tax=Caldivirga sp. TaxID=2080243 RepID=UPI003D0D7D4A